LACKIGIPVLYFMTLNQYQRFSAKKVCMQSTMKKNSSFFSFKHL